MVNVNQDTDHQDTDHQDTAKQDMPSNSKAKR
jgi:hypothetical protein